jgi:hypothetical protein
MSKKIHISATTIKLNNNSNNNSNNNIIDNKNSIISAKLKSSSVLLLRKKSNADSSIQEIATKTTSDITTISNAVLPLCSSSRNISINENKVFDILENSSNYGEDNYNKYDDDNYNSSVNKVNTHYTKILLTTNTRRSSKNFQNDEIFEFYDSIKIKKKSIKTIEGDLVLENNED